MTLDDIVQHFGSFYRMTKEINISTQSTVMWKKKGYIPIVTQIRIEKLTHGALKANLEHCRASEK